MNSATPDWRLNQHRFFKSISVALLLGLLVSITAAAQVRCGTVEYDLQRHSKNPNLEKTDAFEQWIKAKIARSKSLNSTERTQDITYTIPVVVHVIHFGEAIGVGRNISDAQIISQIAAINRDYPRHNADSVNTPAEWKSVAGRIKINFVLAKQDPEGVPTNGITRTQGSASSYNKSTESQFKSLAYWPAEDYLNLWVIHLVDANSSIAYAQLPVSSLPGLEDANDDRLTDGVAIDYTCFGDNSTGGNFNLNSHYNKGRTVTHEIGHIFGLRHIWGDVSSCTGNGDYCDDTPFQDAATFNCPVQPTASCGHDKMFQNYMDYTDDACYNLFTQDQIARMVVVLGNSPRRASLLVSKGAYDPTIPNLDLGIRSIVTPETTACKGTPITPVIQLRNYGSTAVSSTQIQLSVNGSVIETKDFSLSLSYLDTVNVSFSSLSLNANSTLEFKILSTNGTTDDVASDDTVTQNVTLPATVAIPFTQTFDGTPSTWTIVNPDGSYTWANIVAPYSSSTNKAMYIDFYDYETEDQRDELISPVFDLSGTDVATLKFDRAYAVYQSGYADGLRIIASTTCDSKNGVEIYNSSGTSLATSASTTSSFLPKTSSDWKTESISLNAFVGQPNVQLTFIGINQHGNNLYLDNVSVSSGSFTDIAIEGLITPAPVICVDNPVPTLRVVNYGSIQIDGFTVTGSVNNGTVVTKNFPDLILEVGQDTLIALDAWKLKTGTNTIKLTVTTAGSDVAPNNNIVTQTVIVNESKTVIPLRQDFENAYADWSMVSPSGSVNWQAVSTTKGTSVYYDAFSNTALGAQAWLVSPVLDLSAATTASVFFDVSYALSSKGSDRLQVLASTDCGLTYPTLIYDAQASDLASGYSDGATPPSNSRSIATNTEWKPQSDADWKRPYINLDAITGKSDVRLGFVVTNDNGNDVYIDNIEFFLSDTPTPVSVNPYFAIYSNMTRAVKVTFNLPESETVRIQVVNTLGQPVIDSQLGQVLNQTFTIDLDGVARGLYVIRLQMGKQTGTGKVVVGD